jgi:hypothetical protein
VGVIMKKSKKWKIEIMESTIDESTEEEITGETEHFEL